MTPIVCRQCGASSSNDDEFMALEFITVTDNHLVVPGPDGLVSTEIMDSGTNPTPAGRPELACLSCGHQWRTKREIDWTARMDRR